MRSGKLSRVRIFRIDPALDAAMTSAAARRGVPVSALLRDAIRSTIIDRHAAPSARLQTGGAA
ncbi:UNVERIFIED_ORG: putative HicB family RNase H-like nuclease [Methylorubrum zatmanii]